MRKRCVCSEYGSEYTTSEGGTCWRLYVLLPLFVLSYTSPRIPATRIIGIILPPGTDESWDDIGDLAPRCDFLLIQAYSLA